MERTDNNNKLYEFIDLFAGIGGTRLGFENAGCHCVFSSEWDRFAQQTYLANFGELPSGDIREIDSVEVVSVNIAVLFTTQWSLGIYVYTGDKGGDVRKIDPTLLVAVGVACNTASVAPATLIVAAVRFNL